MNPGVKNGDTTGTRSVNFPLRKENQYKQNTVHYVNPLNHSKMYIYTVIDLYTHMAYAKISPNLSEKVLQRQFLKFKNS